MYYIAFVKHKKKKSETLEDNVVETDDDIDMEQLIMLWEERPLLWDKSLEESERQKQEQGCLKRNLSGALSWIWRKICFMKFDLHAKVQKESFLAGPQLI